MGAYSAWRSLTGLRPTSASAWKELRRGASLFSARETADALGASILSGRVLLAALERLLALGVSLADVVVVLVAVEVVVVSKPRAEAVHTPAPALEGRGREPEGPGSCVDD